MKILSFLCVVIIVFSFCSVNTNAFETSAASSIIINADTLEILYNNNCNESRSMASTTKIMTGLLLAESNRLDEIITCTEEAVTVEGSAMGLRAGYKISARDLLYGLMLQSGNDAANVIAYFLSGGIPEFAALMNKKAEQIGMKNTNFVTPSGLDDDEHYTTAYDMAILAAYALKNEEFKKVCSSYTATVSFGNPMQKYVIKNHNRLLKSVEGCIGIKTGFTKKSGRCLVTAAERDGKRIIAVTLKDPNDWKDHTEMLEYGLNALKVKHFSASGREMSVKVLSGYTDRINLSFDDISVGITEENSKNLRIDFKLPSALVAPIEEGQTVGKAVIYLNDLEIKSTPIFTTEGTSVVVPLEKSFTEKYLENIMLMLKTV